MVVAVEAKLLPLLCLGEFHCAALSDQFFELFRALPRIHRSAFPGFRTGTLWKQAIAITGYAFLALFLIAGIAADGLAGALLILGLVAIVFLGCQGS